MRDRPIKQAVEGGIVRGARGRVVQIEQCLGFLTPDRDAVGSAARDQDTVEKGRVLAVDDAAEMRTRPDRRPLALDDGRLHLPDSEHRERRGNLAGRLHRAQQCLDGGDGLDLSRRCQRRDQPIGFFRRDDSRGLR